MPADGITAPSRVESTAVSALQTEAAEHERQFRETLEHCPAGLIVVDEDGRLLFHNARLRELLGYSKEEMELIDTRAFWHDLNQRSRIIETLRDRGGTLLNEEVIYKTKQGHLIHVLMSYVQVAYRGGHISFVGGKRLCWVYDISALNAREAQVAEQERQFREILEYCPAGLIVVNEDGRLLFHNARLREMLGYSKEELDLIDTRKFWHDLEQRARIIEALREPRRTAAERGGDLEDQRAGS